MAYEALRHYSARDLTFRFVSNVDGTDFVEAVRDLAADETLFVVCSKTFTTLETLTNARAARAWCLPRCDDERAVARHFVAVSTNAEAVRAFGIDTANMFGFWDWVGGRYSMDSAIGLSTMLAIGAENFRAMLAGFHAMDEHFRTAPPERNLPLLLGLLAIWNSNFLGADGRGAAVRAIPEALSRVPAAADDGEQRQARDARRRARRLPDEPDLLGRARHQRPAFVLPADPPGHAARPVRLHRLLRAAQSARRPARPADGQPVRAEPRRWRSARRRTRCARKGTPEALVAHRTFEGNPPSNTILAERLTPHTLGALVALYEHSVFVQGTIWNIDSFDQWGVELGKALAKNVAAEIDAARRHRSRARQLDQRADPPLPRVSRSAADEAIAAMTIDPRAGQPAEARDLVDVRALLAAYAALRPDPAVAAQRVAFGTSGHRGSSFDRSFNEWHVLAITQAICEYRLRAGITGPLFLGIDTHALSVPAFRSALEVLAANGVDVLIAADGEFTPTPARLARDPRLQPRSTARACRRHRRHAVAQSAGQRRLQVQPAERRPRRHRRHRLDRSARERAARSRPARRAADAFRARARRAARRASTISLALCRRSRRASSTCRAIRGSGIRMGVDPLGGAGVHYWGRIAERYGIDLTVVSDEVDPTFRFMTLDWDGRIRMDPSSPYAMQRLIALKDRYDIAFACDTDHDRHGIVTPQRRPAAAQPLPGGARSTTCSAIARSGAPRRPSARRSSAAR